MYTWDSFVIQVALVLQQKYFVVIEVSQKTYRLARDFWRRK